mmetsp:Transcript_4212/g.12213  ORF Transcript_4212/g.12213 Transcript_4212/m.12213 type:complete len:676 (-) Transcript_4212:386-2413(-)
MQRHGLHQVPHHDEVPARLHAECEDMAVVHALCAQGAREGAARRGALLPRVHLDAVVHPRHDAAAQLRQRVDRALGEQLGEQGQPPLGDAEHEDAPRGRLGFVRHHESRAHEEGAHLRGRPGGAQGAGEDGERRLGGPERVRVRELEGGIVQEPHVVHLGALVRREGRAARARGAHLLHGADGEGAAALVVGDAPRVLVELHRLDVQLLDVVDGPDGQHLVPADREALGEGLGVEGAHVRGVAEVDVGVEQLVGARGDHRRAVRRAEDVAGAAHPEGGERHGLRPQGDLLAVGEPRLRPRRPGLKGEAHHVAVAHAAEQIGAQVQRGEEQGPRHHLPHQGLGARRPQAGQLQEVYFHARPHAHRHVARRAGERPCGGARAAVGGRGEGEARRLVHQGRGGGGHQAPPVQPQQNQLRRRGESDDHVQAVRRGHRDEAAVGRTPVAELAPRGALHEAHAVGAHLEERAPAHVDAEQRLGAHLEARQLRLLQLLAAHGEHARLLHEGDDEQRVVRRVARLAQRPEALDARQVHRRVLVDADAVAHHPQRAVLEGARAAHHLALTLALEVNDAKVDDGAQVGHHVQHLEEARRGPRARAPGARRGTRAPGLLQADELRVAIGGADEYAAVAQVAERGRAAREAQGLELQARHRRRARRRVLAPRRVEHQHRQPPRVVAE